MKTRKIKLMAIYLILTLSSLPPTFTQSGSFQMEKSVIASGGGPTSGGGQFSLDETTGQPIAGGPILGGSYSVESGFWTSSNRRTLFDFDGDGKADQSVFRSPGQWFVLKSTGGFFGADWGTSTDQVPIHRPI